MKQVTIHGQIIILRELCDLLTRSTGMIEIARYEDSFAELYEKEKRPIVVYGAGTWFRKIRTRLPQIDMLCDKNAANIDECDGIKVLLPSEIGRFESAVYVIVAVYSLNVLNEVSDLLSEMAVDAIVFHAPNNVYFNIAFEYTSPAYHVVKNDSTLKVNIACRDEGWILRKFAVRMYEELDKMGVNVTLSEDTRSDVDVNHHIQFASYKAYPNDTIMFSHIDCERTLITLKEQLYVGAKVICMSKETSKRLISMGFPYGQIGYVNPAHDHVIKPKKYVIGITHRCYDDIDVRKRTSALLEILDGVNPLYFRFIIMGAGWEKVISGMEERGFEITYYPDFDYDSYNKIIQELDYYLFEGFDEGSMGFPDALAAGVGTIVTPQGFHLDAAPIDYPCSTVRQFHDAFMDLQRKREKKIETVMDWTWKNYVQKHLDIWNYMTNRESLRELFKRQLCYEDGIFSMLLYDNRVDR